MMPGIKLKISLVLLRAMLYERGKLRTLLFKGPIVSLKTDNPIPENCEAIGTDILKTNEDGAPPLPSKDVL